MNPRTADDDECKCTHIVYLEPVRLIKMKLAILTAGNETPYRQFGGGILLNS